MMGFGFAVRGGQATGVKRFALHCIQLEWNGMEWNGRVGSWRSDSGCVCVGGPFWKHYAVSLNFLGAKRASKQARCDWRLMMIAWMDEIIEWLGDENLRWTFSEHPSGC